MRDEDDHSVFITIFVFLLLVGALFVIGLSVGIFGS